MHIRVFCLMLLTLSGAASGASFRELFPDPPFFPSVTTERGIPQMPNPQLTPGQADPQCTKVRDVNDRKRQQVYTRYGLRDRMQGICVEHGERGCKIDHLVPVILCGANTLENLWPHAYDGPCNAHNKTRLEVKLWRMVKTQRMTMREAQLAIQRDWITAYRHYVDPKGCGIQR